MSNHCFKYIINVNTLTWTALKIIFLFFSLRHPSTSRIIKYVVLHINNFNFLTLHQFRITVSFQFSFHTPTLFLSIFSGFSTHFLASSLSQGQLDNTVRAKNKRVRKRAGLQQHSSVIIKSHKSVMVFGYRPLDLHVLQRNMERDLKHR